MAYKDGTSKRDEGVSGGCGGGAGAPLTVEGGQPAAGAAVKARRTGEEELVWWL